MSLKIALCGFYGKNNFGDDLMQDCLSEVLSCDGKNEVFIFSDLEKNDIKNGFLNKEYFDCDLIVIGGGGIINKDFWIFRDNGIDELLSSWKNVMFLNVNVYEDIFNDKIFLSKIKSLNAKWWVRDSKSKEHLFKSGIDSVLMPDVIFHKTKFNLKPKENKKVIFFPNYYAFNGTSIRDWVLTQRNVSVLSDYFNWLISFGWHVTISFCQHGQVDDRIIGGMVYSQIINKSNVTWDLEVIDWKKKIELIKEHSLVISMRYHSTLSAVINGIPCVDIVHHDKNKYFWKDLQFFNKSLNMYTIDNQQLCEITNFSDVFPCYLSKIDDYRNMSKKEWNKFEEIIKKIK